MQLIKKVKIEGVRSIQEQELTAVGSLTVFVGRNSSGKSNILRALNLFFNGTIEPGKPVDFSRDHYEQVPRKRKKKKISIKVDFCVPEEFKIRQGLESLQGLQDEFTIERSWTLDQFRLPVESMAIFENGILKENAEDLARQFLSLITYRYIPNQTVPSRILQDESQAIANSIFSRMKGDQHAAALLSSLQAASGRLLEDANTSMIETGAPLKNPSVATANSIGEMLTMGGFRANGAHGLPVQDEDWGAGHQAFFLHQVLKTLDTSYGRFFGWKQATIWGVEEPEAGLHRDLETKLANQFRNWALNSSLRMQIFATTHSPIFTMAAESGMWVEIKDTESVIEPMTIPELTKAADLRGVSGWVHPILYFPWNPVILVEGPIDADVLNHAAKLVGLNRYRFLSLPNLDPNERRGGKDKITTFFRNSHGLVHNRPAEAPCLVLFDWEVSEQDIAKCKQAYGANADQRIRRMDTVHADVKLGNEFKGIERFYPPNVFVEAHEAGDLILGQREGKPFSISQDQLNQAKGKLRDRVLKIDAASELKELVGLVLDIDSAVNSEFKDQLELFAV